MTRHTLTAHPPAPRSRTTADAERGGSDLLRQTLETLNRHLASSLAASGEVKDHGRPDE